MTDIGGDTIMTLQTKTVPRNVIGEQVPVWTDAAALTGWLDLMNGTSSRRTFDTKLQESTHIFLASYVPLDVTPETCRAVIGGQVYDVLLIDDPMGMHEHLEVYLKYTGGRGARAGEAPPNAADAAKVGGSCPK